VTCPVTVPHWEAQLKGLIDQDWETEKLRVCPKEMLDKLEHPLGVERAGSGRVRR
jgi:glutamate synthase (NADPH) large chain